MRRALVVILTLLLGVQMAFGEGQQCKADPDECEKQIRAFLAEKKYLGVTLRMTRWGVVVKSIAPDSPAERGRLLEGDRIIGINGHDSRNAKMSEIKKLLLPPGRDAKLTLLVNRLGEPRRLQVTLSVMPQEQIVKIVQAHLERSHAAPTDDHY